ncbi:AsmA family protein [Flavitalea antarctica]
MKKTGKWKWLLFVSMGIALLITASYLVFIYRFKEILKAVIEKETRGQYTFSAAKVNLSIWDQKITLNKVIVAPLDSAQASADYFISAQKVFLSVESLRDIMFNEKLVVNDIIINEPYFRITVHTDKPRATDEFHPSTITDLINNLTQRLQVRSFRLTNASFEYKTFRHQAPFLADHINLRISNFRKKDSMTNDLMYTDDIDLSIKNQSWKFPGGNQELKFSQLHYSAKDQFVEIDSSTLVIRGEKTPDTISLYADQFRFSPRRLQEHLSNNEFVVDSLVCLRPVLVLRKAFSNHRDSSGSISGALNQMFNKVELRYINIIKGSFAIFEKNRTGSSYSTEQADIRIYNLRALNDQVKPLSVDSVMFNLNNLTFVTNDSLYQLTVSKFGLRNNNLTFIDASFGNAPGNSRPSNMTFTTPELQFRDIDLEELMKKKLKAPAISIYRPTIRLFTNGKKHDDHDSSEKFSFKAFYKVMNGLDELINVDSFRIIDGNMRLRSAKNIFNADFNSINGVVLINKLLQSDSLVDIKRALPWMNVRVASLSSPAFSLGLDNFQFKGTAKHSYAENLVLSAPSGTTVSAKDLTWNILDWDVFQISRIIKIRTLQIRELTATVQPATSPGKKKGSFPVFIIDTFEIGKVGFGLKSQYSILDLNADQIHLTDFSSRDEQLRWTDLRARISPFHFKKNGMDASFKSMMLSNRGINQLRDVKLQLNNNDKEVNFEAPVMNLNMAFQSADFSKLVLESIVSDTASLTILAKKKPVMGQEAGAPGDQAEEDEIQKVSVTGVSASQLNLKNNSVVYINEADSITVKTTLDLSGNTIVYENNEALPFRFKELDVAMRDLKFDQKRIRAFAPSFNARFTDAKLGRSANRLFGINAGIDLNWSSLDFAMDFADSAALTAKNISGTLLAPAFGLSASTKIEWLPLLKLATWNSGQASYENRDLKAEAEDLSWNGPKSSFTSGRFSVKPKVNAATALKKARWQRDELVVDGEKLGVEGISYDPSSGDSTLSINKIILDKINLQASRDKRVPFRHGIEKMMPTKLISLVRFPIAIDSVILKRSNVTIHEISAKTQKAGTIPLRSLEATITNIRNRVNTDDVLGVSATSLVLDNRINHMRYDELYHDSLSPFIMKFYASPMELTSFTKASQPLANVGVKNGLSDTLYAHWTGNKYAAIGRMNFHYRGLKIALLNKDDPEKRQLTLRILNLLANSVVRNAHFGEEMVYYERDTEKFVFNYWVKTTFSGLMSSVGVKRSRKYIKQYNRSKEKFSLPEIPPVTPVSSPVILTSSY